MLPTLFEDEYDKILIFKYYFLRDWINMHECPLCNSKFNVRDLGYGRIFTNYRICPECGGNIIVDKDTRHRYIVFIVISLISLTFTLFLYFDGNKWLFPALATYLVMGVYLWWCNSRVYFVPYEKNSNSKK